MISQKKASEPEEREQVEEEKDREDHGDLWGHGKPSGEEEDTMAQEIKQTE